MRHLAYTADQLARETRLLCSEVSLLTDSIIGDGAGQRALGLGAASISVRPPSRRPRGPERYDVWAEITRVERYGPQPGMAPSLPTDISMLAMVVERIFSPA